MRNHLFFFGFAVLLLAGASGAQAQSVIAQEGVLTVPATRMVAPVAAAPVETVETVRTVQSVSVPRHRSARRQVRYHTVQRVTTTRTITRQSLAPTIATVPPAATTEVVAAPAVAAAPVYSGPLYDVVPAAPPAVAPIVQPIAGAPVAAPLPAYRYVYEPGRILVIDPNTGIAVQALPR